MIFSSYIAVLKKYAVFDGRAGRPEYWWFFLVQTVINTVIYTSANVILLWGIASDPVNWTLVVFGILGNVLGGLYGLATFLPMIGVGIRRLHDTGRSGWWYLVVLIPLVGTIVLLVMAALRGNPGYNQYGPPPA